MLKVYLSPTFSCVSMCADQVTGLMLHEGRAGRRQGPTFGEFCHSGQLCW